MPFIRNSTSTTYDLHCGNAVIRSLAAAYGISVTVSSGWSLVTGLFGRMLAAPSSARHWSSLRALTASWTGGCWRVNGLLPTSVSVTAMLFAGECLVDIECIVPLAGRKHLPICGHAAIAQFYPVLTDTVGKNKRAALDSDGIIEPTRNAGIHGEDNLDAVAGLPGALDAGKGAGCGSRDRARHSL